MPSQPAPSRLNFPDRPLMARARLERPVTLPDYLPVRMLHEYVYCPRVLFYEWVEGLFAHNADTVEGANRHEKLDRKEDELTPAGELSPDERIHARSVQLSSEAHHLIATIDLVEGEGGVVSPVDYKKGSPRPTDAGPAAWPADIVQVCAQALILREHGYRVDEAVVYYHGTRQRVRVPIDEAVVAQTLDALRGGRDLASSGRTPAPLEDSQKCPRCSLVGICLPDETRAAMTLATGETLAAQLPLFADAAGEGRPLGAGAGCGGGGGEIRPADGEVAGALGLQGPHGVGVEVVFETGGGCRHCGQGGGVDDLAGCSPGTGEVGGEV